MKIIRNLFIALAATFVSFAAIAQSPIAHPGHQPRFDPPLTDKCPDLIVRHLAVVKRTSNTIKYKFAIKNIGSAKANLDGPTNANHDNIAVQAFLSKDKTYDNSDLPAGGTILGVSPLGFLAPGATRNGQFGATVAGNTFKYKYLILLVDWKKDLSECNEGNNAKAIPLN